MKINGTWAWTATASIFIPEKQFVHLSKNQSVQALRGYAHTLAVFENEWCVGWILKEHADKYQFPFVCLKSLSTNERFWSNNNPASDCRLLEDGTIGYEVLAYCATSQEAITFLWQKYFHLPYGKRIQKQ